MKCKKSIKTDVTKAKVLKMNTKIKVCFEGIQPGHTGFRLSKKEQEELIKIDTKNKKIIFPYLNGKELLTRQYVFKPRYIIDFDNIIAFLSVICESTGSLLR